jgi:glycosyltransferase involved in cell wall biosynthesis
MLTSRFEGVPIVIYEAMAAGLPVVTVTEKTSIPEVLTADTAWFVRRQDDAASYVDALEKLLSDKERARAAGDELVKKSASFTSRRYAEQMLSLLLPGLKVPASGVRHAS